jgi:hypothetical protein
MRKWISIRVIEAEDLREATLKAERGWFSETHPLCDAILPMGEELEGTLTKVESLT